jgi:hypothetical protein
VGLRAPKLILGLVGLGLAPGLARAQAVVVRHIVRAEVTPLASLRDTLWVRTEASSDSVTWTWTGELRANSPSALQVLGPDADDARVRVGAGPWVRLQAGAWNAVFISGPGKRRIAIEYAAMAGSASLHPPDVRIR